MVESDFKLEDLVGEIHRRLQLLNEVAEILERPEYEFALVDIRVILSRYLKARAYTKLLTEKKEK